LERARALAAMVHRRSPTAVAAFKRATLAGVGRPAALRTEEEARAYEHCVDTGEAAIGREHFKVVLAGQSPPWGPRRPWQPLN
jgi:enoyl-CoA hydratase/carnithine racemase